MWKELILHDIRLRQEDKCIVCAKEFNLDDPPCIVTNDFNTPSLKILFSGDKKLEQLIIEDLVLIHKKCLMAERLKRKRVVKTVKLTRDDFGERKVDLIRLHGMKESFEKSKWWQLTAMRMGMKIEEIDELIDKYHLPRNPNYWDLPKLNTNYSSYDLKREII